MEEFKPYNNLEAQEEAEKLRRKVESGEASSYGEAEKFFELEEKEEEEKPEVIAWAKRIVKQWHDEIKPDYLFFTETGAIPYAYVLKSTWKSAYSDQELPRFYRLETEMYANNKELQKYLSERIKGNDPAIIVFDEGGHGCIGTELVVEDKRNVQDGIKAGKVFLGRTLANGARIIYFGMKDMLGHTPRVYASKDSQYSSIFEKYITDKRQRNPAFSGGQEISRSPTSRTFGDRSNRTQIKSEDEILITGEYLNNLVERSLRGRIVKHPAQRKRALAWVKHLQDIGGEAGEELREENDLEENKNTQRQSFINELPNKEGFVDFSQLQRIGHGGTHDIYVYPKNPAFVIRLNRSVLEKAYGIGQAELPPEMRKTADEYVEDENSKNKQLYEHFGRKHCLREKVILQRISIEQNGVLQNIECVISIQEASDIFKDPNRKSFNTGYAEQDSSVEQSKEAYDRMNRALLGRGNFDENDFLKFNPQLKSIFELIDQDKEFKNCMREFLRRFDDYFRSSGRFIDLVGQENVLFFQQNGKWTFKLGNVIKGENIQVIGKAKLPLEKSPQFLNQDQKLCNQLMNHLALVRLLNAVWLKVGNRGTVYMDLTLTEKDFDILDKVKFK